MAYYLECPLCGKDVVMSFEEIDHSFETEIHIFSGYCNICNMYVEEWLDRFGDPLDAPRLSGYDGDLSGTGFDLTIDPNNISFWV